MNNRKMEDEWKSAFIGLGVDDILPRLRLQLMRVYPSARQGEITFNSALFLVDEQIDMLRQALRKKLPGFSSLEINLLYSDLFDAFTADPADCKRSVVPLLDEFCPGSGRFFEASQWRWGQGRLEILSDNQISILYVQEKGADHHLGKMLSRMFVRSVSVSLIHVPGEQPDSSQTDERLDEAIRLAMKASAASPKQEGRAEVKPAHPSSKLGRLLRDKVAAQPSSIESLKDQYGRVCVAGFVFDTESRQTGKGKAVCTAQITDYTGSLLVKTILDPSEAKQFSSFVKKDGKYIVKGDYQWDSFAREPSLWIQEIAPLPVEKRMDRAPVKRVEMHLHTQMSAMDGMTNLEELIIQMDAWGHDRLVITDHGCVQGFPEAYKAKAKLRSKVKILFGMEGYLVDDCNAIVQNAGEAGLDQEMIVFDLETTGLVAGYDQITEIGAVRLVNGQVTDRFSTLVHPRIPIPQKVVSLTGITNEMVSDAPECRDAIGRFAAFIGGATLAAHNAGFDMSFLRAAGNEHGFRFDNPVLDTLALSRTLYPDERKHTLDALAKLCGIPMGKHHRAVDDAQTAAAILLKFMEHPSLNGIQTLSDLNAKLGTGSVHGDITHIILLVENKTGLFNLYKLVSESNLKYFYRQPRIPRSRLNQFRDGLILGSACEAGELYRAVLSGEQREKLLSIADYYDYLEIQPDGNNAFLIRSGRVSDLEGLHDINRKIIELGKELGKPVVAAGDVHFLKPEDACYRRVLLSSQGYEDANEQAPLYYRTTEEMLQEFSYLGERQAMEVVVDAPRLITDRLQELEPFPSSLCAPVIPGADGEIRELARARLGQWYGENPPDIVSKRLKRELDGVIDNKYAVLYLTAQKLVKNSLDHGYLVGSRGSVGSSFAATMTGITEVNPLPPHYRCEHCRHADFDVDREKYTCGPDLPERECPNCREAMRKDGYDIPFEVFMGFEGNKVPDIDLNFSGEFQSQTHKYTEVLFGADYVFRAGTIGTLAEKTARAFARSYLENNGLPVSNAEINRLALGCVGVKRTTGQHPGGIVVLPKGRDIHEFTPIQHPAEDRTSGTVTTHFDFNSLHDTLVKLDILGHDDPTMIRMLEKLTGLNASFDIEIGEPETMRIFSSLEPLGITSEQMAACDGLSVGTLGIPEFGTRFVRRMLNMTRPTTMEELIRISGLSHGTNVWLDNAETLIQNGTARLNECICTRDDIMLQLSKKMDTLDAFTIMESVRKGNGLVVKNKDYEPIMREAGVDDWFIDSCKKIGYMFPKAHAVAYVLMAFRIAYFKLHHPAAYYTAYYTVRADDFDANWLIVSPEVLCQNIRELESREAPTAKDKGLLTIAEVVLEMFMRGIRFLPLSIDESTAVEFQMSKEGIRPPLNALPGVGESAARAVVAAREETPFRTIEDLRNRAKISRAVIDTLHKSGALAGLPETSQVSFFNML